MIDTIFLNIVLLIAVVIFLRQYLNFTNSLICALSACVSLNGLLRIRRSKKFATKPTKQEQKQYAEILFYLQLCSPQERCSYFVALFQKHNAASTTPSLLPEVLSRCILLADGFVLDNCLYLTDLAPKTMEEGTLQKMLQNYYIFGCTQVVMVTHNALPKECTKLLTLCTQSLTHFDKDALFVLIQKTRLHPTLTIHPLPQKKRTRLSLLAHLVSPKNIRKYLVASLLLFLYAYFMRGSIYYLFFGFVCLTLAVVCKIKSLMDSSV